MITTDHFVDTLLGSPAKSTDFKDEELLDQLSETNPPWYETWQQQKTNLRYTDPLSDPRKVNYKFHVSSSNDLYVAGIACLRRFTALNWGLSVPKENCGRGLPPLPDEAAEDAQARKIRSWFVSDDGEGLNDNVRRGEVLYCAHDAFETLTEDQVFKDSWVRPTKHSIIMRLISWFIFL